MMGCGGCNKRRAARNNPQDYDIMGGRKYLTDRQLRARLEAYKKRFCPDCENRYKCDYEMYVKCKKT